MLDVNDVNGTQTVIRVGSDTRPRRSGSSRALGRRVLWGDQRAHGVRASPALTRAGGTTAPTWRSSAPRSWLPPFVASLTFPSARHDFVRFFRTSSTRQPGPANHPRRSHANDVNPQQLPHVRKPPAHKSPLRSSAASSLDCGSDRAERGNRTREIGRSRTSGAATEPLSQVLLKSVNVLADRRGHRFQQRASSAGLLAGHTNRALASRSGLRVRISSWLHSC